MNQKRHVELSVLSVGSFEQSVLRPLEIVKYANRIGSKAVAITDWYSALSFVDMGRVIKAFQLGMPEAPRVPGFKVIYGARLKSTYADEKCYRDNNITLLVKKQEGLRNLYRILSSVSYGDDVKNPSPVEMSVIEKYRDGLLLGYECDPEWVSEAMALNEDELDRAIKEHFEGADYVELRPWHLPHYEEAERETIVRIVKRMQDLNLCPAAVSDAVAITKEDEICRKILQGQSGMENARYLRPTEEVLEEFSFLGDLAETVVIDNTNIIADRIEEVFPSRYPKDEFVLPNAQEEVEERCREELRKRYPKRMNSTAQERLLKEFKMIADSNAWSEFLLISKIVDRCNDEGWPFMFRGTVANSYAAHLLGFTETNPIIVTDFRHKSGSSLPPEFFYLERHGCPRKPNFEMCVPEEVCGKLYGYICELVGGEQITAGSVETMLLDDAESRIDRYRKEYGVKISKLDRKIIAEKLHCVPVGIGCNPGAFLLVPKEKEIYDYAPLMRSEGMPSIALFPDWNRPLERIIVNGLPILSELYRYGAENKGQPIPHYLEKPPRTDVEIVEYRENGDLSGLRIGEDETHKIAEVCKPEGMMDLVWIYGLKHGTWVKEDLIQDILEYKECPYGESVFREDIMLDMMNFGIDRLNAFVLAEYVRTGRAAYRGFDTVQEELLKKHNVPNHYVEYLKRIFYLFSKGHEMEYVRKELQVMWCRKHLKLQCHDT